MSGVQRSGARDALDSALVKQGHGGRALVVVPAWNEAEALPAVLVYLFAYYVTTLTAFAVVCAVSAEGRGHDARRHPVAAGQTAS